jgi:hypothetical protein
MRMAVIVFVIVLVMTGPGTAAWQTTGSGTGSVGSKTMPATPGATPSATVPLASHNVTVTWTASTFLGGVAVPSYVVKRYDGILGTVQTIGAACSGLVSATSCVEAGVPTGTWKYTITPAAGSWRGTEGAQSSAVAVT